MVSIYGRLCFLRALSQPKRVVVVGTAVCARLPDVASVYGLGNSDTIKFFILTYSKFVYIL